MERQLYLGGRFVGGGEVGGGEVGGGEVREIRAPWDGAVVSRVHQASWAQLDEALALAFRSRRELWTAPAGARRMLCQAIADGIRARSTELAEVICAEAGKPIGTAQAEVARAIWTFALAAGVATEDQGALVPVDLDDAHRGYLGLSRQVPSGVVVGISPFNFPLNLAAHKVAPALAIGAPIILKPPPQAPSAALILAEIALAAGAPPAALQVAACSNELAERLAVDPRVAVVSFTGSARVGWQLKTRVPRARVVLELGGNAAAVIAEDADFDRALERVALAGYVYSGQVCISVQRIFVERALHPRFMEGLRRKVASYQVADPRAAGTVVGPLIDEAAALRIEGWLREAVAAGASVEGGARAGNRLQPAIVEGAPRDSKVVREEVFGPVVVVEPYDDLEAVNQGDYGLQAGIFTHDLRKVRRAWEVLEVGGVIGNDAPTFRADNMPYGGVKGSGLGREGVRLAAAELCEPRLLVLGPG